MKSSRCWPREDWDLVIMIGSNGASDQAQESDLNHKMRAQPLILVLLFLAAVCLSTILSKATAWLTMWQLGPFSYVELLSQLLSFPFSIVCVVWIGARSGRTGWSTWTVPLLLWVAAMLIGMIGSVLVNLGSLSYQITSHLMPGVLISIDVVVDCMAVCSQQPNAMDWGRRLSGLYSLLERVFLCVLA